MARPKRASLSDFAATKPSAAPIATKPPADGNGADRRGMTVRLSPDAWKQLKQVALDHGVTAHELLIRGLNKVFAEYGKPPIA